MAVVAPLGAPTRVDAEAAAEVLIAAGAAEVLLFGSVARGDACADSDIDLVAIFADLDYAERQVRQRALQAAAGAAVPWPVQVHVTDRPEWRARVERVATSFEHRIAAASVPLAAGDEAPVDWGKEMVLPMSDPEEALSYFTGRVLPRLQAVATAATRSAVEVVPPAPPAVPVEVRRLNRMVSLCVDAALAAETSVKAMAKLYGQPTPTEKDLKRNGHTIAAVLQRHVPAPHSGEMRAAFDRCGVDLVEVSQWRNKGTYADDVVALRAEADDLAPVYAAMASEITGLVVSHLRRSLGSAVASAAAERDSLAAVIAGQDVRLGIPASGGLDV